MWCRLGAVVYSKRMTFLFGFPFVSIYLPFALHDVFFFLVFITSPFIK